MAYRLAIGQYRPYIFPLAYTDATSCVNAARDLFQQYEEKVTFWAIQTELSLRIAEAGLFTTLARFSPRSWKGSLKPVSIADYPDVPSAGEREDGVTDAAYSDAEYRNYLETGISNPDKQYFGPFLADGVYRAVFCGNKISVYYDVDNDGDTTVDDLAIGPLGLDNINPFLWKYRAIPDGIDATLIAWSSATGPEYTFTGLIPGITYTIQYTDMDEEIELT